MTRVNARDVQMLLVPPTDATDQAVQNLVNLKDMLQVEGGYVVEMSRKKAANLFKGEDADEDTEPSTVESPYKVKSWDSLGFCPGGGFTARIII